MIDGRDPVAIKVNHSPKALVRPGELWLSLDETGDARVELEWHCALVSNLDSSRLLLFLRLLVFLKEPLLLFLDEVELSHSHEEPERS